VAGGAVVTLGKLTVTRERQVLTVEKEHVK